MARPKNTGAEWFDYSVHTLSDPKIDMLRLKHKADGFLFYMYMLEQIYRTEYYELDLSNDTDYVVEYYSLKMDITTKDFWDILETCFKVNLFDRSIYNSAKRLTSNGIKKRAVAIEEKREYDRKRYEKNKKGKSFHSENDVKTNENKVENSENEVNSQSFHNKRREEKRTEENRTEQNIIKKNNCETSFADDDDEDLKEDLKTDDKKIDDDDDSGIEEAKAVLMDHGISGNTAKIILDKHVPEYVIFKIRQIDDMNKSGQIKNLKGYILKTFENTDPDTADDELCVFISEQRRKEEARKPKIDPALKRINEQQAKDDKFIQETELLYMNASEKDKQAFLEAVVEPSKMYKDSFSRGGFENGFISVLFRTFLQNKYRTAE